MVESFNLTPHSLLTFAFLDQATLDLSANSIRSIAIVVILLRAGLHLKWDDLKKTGRPALLLSIVPLSLEVLAVYHFSQVALGLSATEASLLSFCIAAVSPAVIVPSMLQLIRGNQGMSKKIPTIILAGASLDDVFALAGFSAMLALAQNLNGLDSLSSVPFALLNGLLCGFILGYLIAKSLKKAPPFSITAMTLVICFILYYLEQQHLFPFSSIIAIMSLGFSFARSQPEIVHHISEHLKWLWKPAELILFLSVGAAVSTQHISQAGWLGLALILIGLVARSSGVWLSLVKTKFTNKEKIFCCLSYLPKATVQAAIGGIVLHLILKDQLELKNGIAAGEMILAISVMSIAITAPLGAIAIHKTTHFIEEQSPSNI